MNRLNRRRVEFHLAWSRFFNWHAPAQSHYLAMHALAILAAYE